MNRIVYHKGYGRCLLELNRYDEAEEQLTRAYESYKTTLGEGHAFTRDSLQLLIGLYEEWQKPEKAKAYRSIQAASTSSQ